jgi:hypothetical protein
MAQLYHQPWDTARVGRRDVLDVDWRRMSRWCCLGTIVMVLWLLAPVARCSFNAFRDIPLNDAYGSGDAPANADRDRVKGARGFASTWVSSIESCYERTPLLGQEDWKSWLLFGFGSVMVIAWLVGGIENRITRRGGRG